MWVTSPFIGPSGWPSLLMATRDAAGGTSSPPLREPYCLAEGGGGGAGLRPTGTEASQGEARHQARVQRHTVEQRIEHTPYVQILDAPVPQVADFVLDVFRAVDSSIAEQVIEVPNLSCSSCPSRSPCLEPQMAEQLVDVPTALSYALLQQRNVEQIVDIPVPLGRVRRLEDSLPRQGSTASGAEQIADSPLGGGLQGFSPGHESGQRSAEQNVDIPVRRSRAHGGLQGFSPGQSSTQRTVTPNDDLPVPGPRPSRGFPPRQDAATAGLGRVVEQIVGAPVPQITESVRDCVAACAKGARTES